MCTIRELYNLCTFRDNMCTQGHFPTDEIVVSSTQAHRLGAIPQFLQLGFQTLFLLLLSNFYLDPLSSFSFDKKHLCSGLPIQLSRPGLWRFQPWRRLHVHLQRTKPPCRILGQPEDRPQQQGLQRRPTKPWRSKDCWTDNGRCHARQAQRPED